jgi:hypothetical protein
MIHQFNSYIILCWPITNHKDSTIKGCLTIGVTLRVIYMVIGMTVDWVTNSLGIGIKYRLLTKCLQPN